MMTIEFEEDSQAASPVSLSMRAADILRGEILSCQIRPGASVSEAGINDRLLLGRAPVRAALARLADEGLVRAIPRKGWVVSPVTARDLDEVFGIRALIEPEGARLAAGRTRHSDVLDAAFAACADDPQIDQIERLRARKALHVAIARLADNERLVRLVDRLWDESLRMLILGASRGYSGGLIGRADRALHDALVNGQAVAAADAMAEAVRASREVAEACLATTDIAAAGPGVLAPGG